MPVADRVTSAPPEGPAPRIRERTLAIVTAVTTLPILWLGYGTDLDVEGVLLAGERIRQGDYVPSRSPGVPVVEAIVGVLDPLGGHVAINLATATALAATVIGCARLVRAYGRPHGELVALAFLVCPVTLTAGSSTTDFIWALAFFVWAALAHLQSRTLVAGLLFALAIGSRSSTALLVVSFLVADGWMPEHRLRCAATTAGAVPLGLLLYVPSWLAYDRTFAFLDSTYGWQGLANNAGRFAIKNYAMAGVLAVGVLAVAVPALVRSLWRWTTDPLVRFAGLGFVMTEGLFFVMPWKLAHLLPCLLMLLLWLSATEWNRPTYLWLLIAAVALNGLVAVRPLVPDDPDASRSASFEPTVTVGLLLNDVRCRARFMHDPPMLESAAWPCALEPLRGPSHPLAER